MSEGLPPERWFLAHTKNAELAELEQMRHKLTEHWKKSGRQIELTLGREDFEARAMRLGGFEAWGRNVATGRMANGRPRFGGFILPGAVTATLPSGNRLSQMLGRTTFEMLQAALRTGKWVYLYDATGFIQVLSMQRGLDDSYTNWGRALMLPKETT